jgi:hypothetical protein
VQFGVVMFPTDYSIAIGATALLAYVGSAHQVLPLVKPVRADEQGVCLDR